MLLVIDASALIKAFVEEQGSAEARQFLAAPFTLVAPGHAIGECAEVLARKIAKAELNKAQAMEAIAAIRQSVGFIAPDELIELAVDIAIASGVSVYDSLYVAAARRLNCRMVTADARLTRKMGATEDANLLINLGSTNG